MRQRKLLAAELAARLVARTRPQIKRVAQSAVLLAGLGLFGGSARADDTTSTDAYGMRVANGTTATPGSAVSTAVGMDLGALGPGLGQAYAEGLADGFASSNNAGIAATANAAIAAALADPEGPSPAQAAIDAVSAAFGENATAPADPGDPDDPGADPGDPDNGGTPDDGAGPGDGASGDDGGSSGDGGGDGCGCSCGCD